MIAAIPAEAGPNEEPCRSFPGFCIDTDATNCPIGGTLLSGYCPTKPAGVKCCTSMPYDETACTNIGGNCVDDVTCGSGTLHSGKCPTQPAGIRCCVPQATTPPGMCSNLRTGWLFKFNCFLF